MSFFFFEPDGSHPLGRPGLLYLLIVAIGAALSCSRKRQRFLLVWGPGGILVIELLWRLHPHWDAARIYLPAGIALVAFASISVAELFSRQRILLGVLLLSAVLILDVHSLAEYFRNGRPDWRPVADFLKAPGHEGRVFTENQWTQLCTAFYVSGPRWLFEEGKRGRPIWNLDGEVSRLSYSWPPGETAWVVLAGGPVHEDLRRWVDRFPGARFPFADDARVHRLDPSMRETSLRLH